MTPGDHTFALYLVELLREDLGNSDDGEWGRIGRVGLDFVAGPLGLPDLAEELRRDYDAGGAPISRADIDKIAAACGLYLYEAGPEEAPPRGQDPELDYRIAQCRIECGLGIHTDEEDQQALLHVPEEWGDANLEPLLPAPRPYGPITQEEDARQRRERQAVLQARLLGVMRRSVQ